MNNFESLKAPRGEKGDWRPGCLESGIEGIFSSNDSLR